jgi:hypothetical protein
LRGAGEVEVRFADDDTLLGFWDRLVIRRTINDCCLFLRRLGLSPPPVSPIIGVASLPIALTPGSAFTMSADLGTACMCSASSAPDTAGFVYQKPYHKIQIASAYTHCYIFRLFTRGEVKVLEGFPLIATRLMDLYFCHAFANTPFTAPGKDGSIERWISALLSIRSTCGRNFTDIVLAYTLQLLVTANQVEGESFDEWLYKSISAAMMNTATHSTREKVAQAVTILIDRGVVQEDIVHRERLGIQ